MAAEKILVGLAEQLQADYRACFLGASWDRVLADLARLGFMAETTFVPGDPCHSAFREGARSVVLHIFGACDLLALDRWMKQFKAKKKSKTG
jgi:hypothetical protein